MNLKYNIFSNMNLVFILLPIILLPQLGLWIAHYWYREFFSNYRESILFLNILYIVFVRLILLDTALLLFSHYSKTTHLTLIRIVALYLEITVITILYFALIFDMFDVFTLFHLNSSLSPQNVQAMYDHSFITSFYISSVTFTTVGFGDWTPSTINAMIAVSAEAILGVIQSGVFVAILIYAHQNRTLTLKK